MAAAAARHSGILVDTSVKWGSNWRERVVIIHVCVRVGKEEGRAEVEEPTRCVGAGIWRVVIFASGAGIPATWIVRPREVGAHFSCYYYSLVLNVG